MSYLFNFGLGFLGGLIASFGLRFASARRCTRLEWAVSDLSQRLATLGGKKAATARWEREATLEQQFAELVPKTPATRRRYDNDPLGE